MNQPLRFVYFGTPAFSTLVLDALADAGYLPALVVTTPDRPAGRGLELTMSPVKQWALAREIPVLQPEKFDEPTLAALRATHAELFIVAAYGKILPAALLAIPSQGALNVHPSLLPRYRGTSPVESQILADEKHIGVSIILMDEKMDHGPLVAQEEIALPELPRRNDLNTLLWSRGGALLATILPSWLAGDLRGAVQDDTLATVTKKIKKEDGEIKSDDRSRSAYLKYLAYEGWPGVYFFDPAAGGKRVKITRASFTNNQFTIERVIPEGGREISVQKTA